MEGWLEELLEKHSPDVGRLALQLQGWVMEVYLAFVQDVSLRLNALYFKAPRVVCALTLHTNHINLHFYRGVELPDPKGALLGSGKKLRHLKYLPGEKPDQALLQTYVRAAVALEAA